MKTTFSFPVMFLPFDTIYMVTDLDTLKKGFHPVHYYYPASFRKINMHNTIL